MGWGRLFLFSGLKPWGIFKKNRDCAFLKQGTTTYAAIFYSPKTLLESPISQALSLKWWCVDLEHYR